MKALWVMHSAYVNKTNKLQTQAISFYYELYDTLCKLLLNWLGKYVFLIAGDEGM